MWLLSILSPLFIHIMLISGIIFIACSVFLGTIKFIKTYQFPIQLLGVVLLCTGLYYEGALSYKEFQAKAVSKLELKLKDAEIKTASLNATIAAGIHKDTEVIYKKGDVIIKTIQSKAGTIDNRCIITPDVIDALNQAASLDESTVYKKDKP